MIVIALALQSASVPDAVAMKLGHDLARQGTIASLLPLIAAKETDELVAAHRELSDADQAALRRTAAATFDTGWQKLMAATAREYARRLSIADMRKLVAFNATPAAQRYRRALPQVIAATMVDIGAMDFKGETLRAFCDRTGKLCPPK